MEFVGKILPIGPDYTLEKETQTFTKSTKRNCTATKLQDGQGIKLENGWALDHFEVYTAQTNGEPEGEGVLATYCL